MSARAALSTVGGRVVRKSDTAHRGGEVVAHFNAWSVRVRWDDGTEGVLKIKFLKRGSSRDIAARKAAVPC